MIIYGKDHASTSKMGVPASLRSDFDSCKTFWLLTLVPTPVGKNIMTTTTTPVTLTPVQTPCLTPTDWWTPTQSMIPILTQDKCFDPGSDSICKKKNDPGSDSMRQKKKKKTELTSGSELPFFDPHVKLMYLCVMSCLVAPAKFIQLCLSTLLYIAWRLSRGPCVPFLWFREYLASACLCRIPSQLGFWWMTV